MLSHTPRLIRSPDKVTTPPRPANSGLDVIARNVKCVWMCITLECEKAGSEEPAFCPHLQCQFALQLRLANPANQHANKISGDY